MSEKNLKKTETLRKVTVYYRVPTDSVPEAFVTDFTGWKNMGHAKSAVTFSQPITVNTDDFADKGAKLTSTEYDPCTLTVPIGQFDEDTDPIIFDGGGDSTIDRYDAIVHWEYAGEQKDRQIFLPDALRNSIGDYAPEKGSAASVDVVFSSDSNVRLDGKSYLPLRAA